MLLFSLSFKELRYKPLSIPFRKMTGSDPLTTPNLRVSHPDFLKNSFLFSTPSFEAECKSKSSFHSAQIYFQSFEVFFTSFVFQTIQPEVFRRTDRFFQKRSAKIEAPTITTKLFFEILKDFIL